MLATTSRAHLVDRRTVWPSWSVTYAVPSERLKPQRFNFSRYSATTMIMNVTSATVAGIAWALSQWGRASFMPATSSKTAKAAAGKLKVTLSFNGQENVKT